MIGIAKDDITKQKRVRSSSFAVFICFAMMPIIFETLSAVLGNMTAVSFSNQIFHNSSFQTRIISRWNFCTNWFHTP